MSQLIKVGDASTDHFQVTDEEAEAALRLFRSIEHEDLTVLVDRVLDAKQPTSLALALAAVQAELPEVIKAETAKIEKKDGSGHYKYSYADLAAVTRTILPRLGRYGLSWITKPTLLDGRFVLEYKLLHISGESESGIYPLPDRGNPQDIGSAITYARRYTLCSVTGIAPDDDDDGAAATAEHRRAAPMSTPAISNFERDTGLALLRLPTDEERQQAGAALMRASFTQSLQFKACIDEHSAFDLPSNGDGSPTWSEAYKARIMGEIAAIDNEDDGRATWAALVGEGVEHLHCDGEPLQAHMRARRAELDERNANALNTITAQVLAAPLEDLRGDESPVLLSIAGALDLGRITRTQLEELLELCRQRRAKLERENNVLPESDDYDRG